MNTLLAPLGLQYRVRLETDLPTTLVRNQRLLADYADGSYVVAPENRYRAVDVATSTPGVTIAELLTQAAPLSIDDVLAMIADGAIGADLRSGLLTEHDRFQLWPDLDTAALMATPAPVARGELDLGVGAKLTWGQLEYTVMNTTDDFIYVSSDQGSTRIALTDLKTWTESGDIAVTADGRASIAAAIYENRNYLDIANARLARIQPFLDGRRTDPDRSERRYLDAYRRAERLYGNGFPGLFPGRGGNRTPGVEPEQREIADEIIRTQLLTPEQRAVRKGYILYAETATQRGVVPVALSTFQGWYGEISSAVKAAGRWGQKAANSAAMRGSSGGSPVRGDRALERVHIDHTPIDVPLRDKVTNQDLGRPWLSVAIDAYSRRIVAWTLLFDSPSARTVQLLIREIVRNHGRLPDTLVVDNGKEFHSKYLQALAASHGVNLEYRPKGNPRFGGPVEGFFKQILADLFGNMQANNKIRRNVRSMSPSHNPSSRTVWTFPAMCEEIATYLELYHSTPIRTLGGSPVQLWDQTVNAAGARPHKQLVLDTAMLALTAFPAPGKDGKAKILRNGVRIRNLIYWNPIFGRPGLEGTRVPAVYESLDARKAYVYIDKTWHACRAEYPELDGRTDAEVRSAGIVLRRRLGMEPSMGELARYLFAMQGREAKLALDKQQQIEALRSGAQRDVLNPESTELTPPASNDAIAPSDFDGEIEEVATYEQPAPAQRPAA